MEITIKVEDNELLQRREAVINALSQILGAESKRNPKSETAQIPEPAQTPEPTKEPEITISDLRKKGTELTKAGKLPELQEVFAEFGAKKLSGLAEADYPAVMKRLEEL